MKTTAYMSDTEQFDLQRRRVLLGMAATGAAIVGSSLTCPAMAAAAEQVTTAPRSDKTQDHQAFFGKHQSGIVTPRPACGMVVAFDVLASDRQDLERLFRTLNERIAFLMTGGTVPRSTRNCRPPIPASLALWSHRIT